MIAAEQWHEQQCRYQKYGIDMKPRTAVKPRTQEAAVKWKVTKKDKAMLLTCTMLAGMLCVCMILVSAYATSINYRINAVSQQNLTLQGEIENLNVKIQAENNLAAIEQKAMAIGMVYPSPSQFVFMEKDTNEIKDFALLLKEHAYQ